MSSTRHCADAEEDKRRINTELDAEIEEIEEITSVPMVTVVNKADVKKYEGFFNMSTISGEGVEEVLTELLRIRKENMIKEVVDIRSELPVPEMRRHGGRTKSKKDAY